MDNISESGKLKKIRGAIQILEQQRTNTLYMKKQIGRMTLQQKEVDYHITNKKVNFKWQRGIKIGIFTCMLCLSLKKITFDFNGFIQM